MTLISIWIELWIKETHVTGVAKNLLFTLKTFTWWKSNSLGCYEFNRGNRAILLWKKKMVKLKQLTVSIALKIWWKKKSPKFNQKRN